MQQNSELYSQITFLTSDKHPIDEKIGAPPLKPFDDRMLELLDAISKKLLSSGEIRSYPDVASFAFWIRMSSMRAFMKRLDLEDTKGTFGVGVAFHIAPSNVPVNFAYSLAVGLMSGNINIVRVPSKEFEQVDMIAKAINDSLVSFPELDPYITLIRYDRQKEITDYLSGIADVRIVWGGDATIGDIRRSPLGPRAREVTFADRYSLAVFDSDIYMASDDKDNLVDGFYNDTYWTDQNACTSPQLIVWHGEKTQDARNDFWDRLRTLVEKRYEIQPVQCVDKYSMLCTFSSKYPSKKKVTNYRDNLLIRLEIDNVTSDLTDFKFNSGLFAEYECGSVEELRNLCNDKKVQTITYIGDKKYFEPILGAGIKGVDRIVPVGHSMDFDLIWDGYQLMPMLTRTIDVK